MADQQASNVENFRDAIARSLIIFLFGFLSAKFCATVPQVLFRVALALLRFMEPALLTANGVGAVYDMLRSPVLEDDLVENMYGFWLQGFSTDILIQLRDQHLVFVTSQDQFHRNAYGREHDILGPISLVRLSHVWSSRYYRLVSDLVPSQISQPLFEPLSRIPLNPYGFIFFTFSYFFNLFHFFFLLLFQCFEAVPFNSEMCRTPSWRLEESEEEPQVSGHGKIELLYAITCYNYHI